MSSSAGQHDDPTIAIYSVCDSRFFLGLVALINSLRIHGHNERIFVTDCGLQESERRIISQEATLLSAPQDAPYLLKYVGPTTHPADVMVMLDADIIVTRPLTPLTVRARRGKFVAFVDRLHDRFFPEWQRLLDLPELRRQPYVNSGFFLAPRERGLALLASLQKGQPHIDMGRTFLGSDAPDYPFFFPDQDVLNAVLSAETERDELEFMNYELAPHPPFTGLDHLDIVGVTCSYQNGTRPFGLHHVMNVKPWLTIRRPSVYSRLLPRLWLADDLPIQMSPLQIPAPFRSGLRASAARWGSYAFADFRSVRGRVGSRLRLYANGRDHSHAEKPTVAELE